MKTKIEMKKLFAALLIMLAFSFAVVPSDAAKVRIHTSSEMGDWVVRIRNLNGMTNIRTGPSSRSRVCIKLKAHTVYDIYCNGSSNGWYSISSIYNATEGYWINFRNRSRTGYWISSSIVY